MIFEEYYDDVSMHSSDDEEFVNKLGDRSGNKYEFSDTLKHN